MHSVCTDPLFGSCSCKENWGMQTGEAKGWMWTQWFWRVFQVPGEQFCKYLGAVLPVAPVLFMGGTCICDNSSQIFCICSCQQNEKLLLHGSWRPKNPYFKMKRSWFSTCAEGEEMPGVLGTSVSSLSWHIPALTLSASPPPPPGSFTAASTCSPKMPLNKWQQHPQCTFFHCPVRVTQKTPKPGKHL